MPTKHKWTVKKNVCDISWLPNHNLREKALLLMCYLGLNSSMFGGVTNPVKAESIEKPLSEFAFLFS